jgi:hypothetical protein
MLIFQHATYISDKYWGNKIKTQRVSYGRLFKSSIAPNLGP